MIPRIEYRDVVDKSTWGDGLWQHEPDKAQWWDEPAGMACVIVRPYTGSLCGYVGAPPHHPAYGLYYDGVPQAEAEARQKAWHEHTRAWAKAGYPDLMKWMQAHPLPPNTGPMPGIGERLLEVRVHGGLTYSGGVSAALDETDWAKYYAPFDSLRAQALVYPRGDAARALADWGPGEHDYGWWLDRCAATRVCAVDDAGKIADLWWFGFDCGHAGDFQPGIHALLRELKIRERLPPPPDWEEVYRDWAYVEGEVEALAVQFAEMVVDLAMEITR